MIIGGRIEVNVDTQTVTIQLDNGMYGADLKPGELHRFIFEEEHAEVEDLYPMGYVRFE